MEVFWTLAGLLAGGFLIFAATRAVCIVPQARARNVERLGRYRATLAPGPHLLIPFADRLRPAIDRRERVISLREPVITEDNVDLRIHTVLYFKVIDPYKADYHVADYVRAIEKLTGTVLRNVIGKLSLNAALTSRGPINDALLANVGATSQDDWGIEVTRVEVLTIDPPPSVKEAMEDRQGAILRAEGQAEAIDTVFAAIHKGDPDPKLLAYQYLQALPQLTQGQGSTVVVVPSELTDALKAVGTAFGVGPAATPGPATPGERPPDTPARPDTPGGSDTPAGPDALAGSSAPSAAG